METVFIYLRPDGSILFFNIKNERVIYLYIDLYITICHTKSTF